MLLTIEEIKALEIGDWIWIEERELNRKFYAQIRYDEKGIYVFRTTNYDVVPDFDNYGKWWFAYKNKEQVGRM